MSKDNHLTYTSYYHRRNHNNKRGYQLTLKLRTSLFVFLPLLLIVGCTSSPTRQCPAFDSALADSWSTGLNEGDIINYSSETGELTTLTLMSRQDSFPFETVARFDNAELICRTSSERQFTFTGSDSSLRIRIEENLRENPDDSTEHLSALVSPVLPDGIEPNFGFSLFLDDVARDFYGTEFAAEAGDVVTRIVENFEAVGTSYGFAVEQKFEDVSRVENSVADPNQDIAITRVVFAEDVGLVQFEKLNGAVFTRQ